MFMYTQKLRFTANGIKSFRVCCDFNQQSDMMRKEIKFVAVIAHFNNSMLKLVEMEKAFTK